MIGGMTKLNWPEYLVTFSDGAERKFIARNAYEARDRAEKYAASSAYNTGSLEREITSLSCISE